LDTAIRSGHSAHDFRSSTLTTSIESGSAQ
jgi:hypothetical protein